MAKFKQGDTACWPYSGEPQVFKVLDVDICANRQNDGPAGADELSLCGPGCNNEVILREPSWHKRERGITYPTWEHAHPYKKV